MKQFLLTLPRHLIDCFRGRMFLWHLVAILLTLMLVQSGFDWFYFSSTRDPILREWMIPSAPIGGLVPLMLPLVLILTGFITSRQQFSRFGWAIGQAELIGSLISSTYKAFTGRVHPLREAGADISHDFRFGCLRGGVFWGWPSSHTTIAFAMAAAVFTMLPKHRWLSWLALTYAAYIGLGVSMTIHWFSDFVAGAILGTVIGVVVGKGFSTVNPASQTVASRQCGL